MKEINILGSKWTIKEQSEKENKLLEDCDGYCDWTTKEIVVQKELEGSLLNMDAYVKKVTRHEIIHAFLFESGLAECTDYSCSWANIEERLINFKLFSFQKKLAKRKS